MTAVALDIEAQVLGADPSEPHELSTVRGQVEVATSHGRVVAAWLVPENPPACAEASWRSRTPTGSSSGPGSWFTSRDAAPAGARASRGAGDDDRGADAGAQPVAAAGGDHRVLAGEPRRGAAGPRTDLGLDFVVADQSGVTDPRGLHGLCASLGADWSCGRRRRGWFAAIMTQNVWPLSSAHPRA